VPADSEGLYKCKLLGRQAAAWIYALYWHYDIISKTSVSLNAHSLIVSAAVNKTPLTGIALAAVEVRVAGYDITCLKTLGVLRYLNDPCTKLMAGDTWICGKRLIACEACYVCSADSAVEDLKKSFTFTWGGLFCLYY
jgi:hypothetical protein